MSVWTVYKHTFPNGKIYVGITGQDPYKRWKHGNGYATVVMKNAIRKYGWDNILHEILYDNLTKEEAEQKEIELICKFRSNELAHGYNLASGGAVNCGYKRSAENIEKMRERMRGKPGIRLGSHLTVEQKKHLSEINKGKRLSQETKAKMSVARANGNTWNARPVINVDTGEIFQSQRAAGIKLKINYKNINLVLKGARKTAGGYRWKYYDN